ncbi:MAG: tyrosine-type recombinase/integrase [Candidatus Micrarchaeota archaeon]|nr:tyrosine-type recombinase/integrase [Candidatus Micrarchaeota archaeon]
MDQDWGKRLETLGRSIKADETISNVNKQIIFEHVDFLKANGKDVKTAIKHLYSLKAFMKAYASKTDLRQATRKDMEKAMGNLNAMSLGDETKRDIRAIVKQLYKEILGEGLYYPPVVAWIKTMNRKGSRLLPDDILSEEEVLSMIRKANDIRDKAIIALLFDSGIRAGELLSMRKKDVDLSGEPVHIIVNGKTGMRKIPILFSAPYLGAYLNQLKDKRGDDFLWWNLAQSHILGRLDGPGLRKMLRATAASAGVDKRIYPHLFRHSRASNYANRLTEQQLKVYFGWTGDSRMAATYVHLSGRDIDNAILQAHGLKPKAWTSETKLKVRTCPKCRTDNTVDAIYCTRCGSALNIDTAIKQAESEKKLKELIEDHITDPKTSDELIRRHLKRKSSKR